MRNGPEFLAIGVWCAFVAVIAIADNAEIAPKVTSGPTTVIAHNPDALAPGKVLTGRSSISMASTGPYGALFVDPSLQDDRVYKGPKPTSADLTAK